MDFKDEILKKDFKVIGKEKWRKLMKFITKQERTSFRESLHLINNRLYFKRQKRCKEGTLRNITKLMP